MPLDVEEVFPLCVTAPQWWSRHSDIRSSFSYMAPVYSNKTKKKHLQILGIYKVSTLIFVMNYYRFNRTQCGVFTWTAVESASPTSPGGNYSASSSWDKELQLKLQVTHRRLKKSQNPQINMTLSLFKNGVFVSRCFSSCLVDLRTTKTQQ